MAKKQTEPSKKTVQKAKEKVIEDKTFGLKNKNKSNKVAKFVQQVQQQVLHGNNKKPVDPLAASAAKKKEELKAKEELALLFKPVIAQQKVQAGVDPKSIVCAFFKVGQCAKGDKCKFSHDLAVERKGGKIDIYADTRGAEEGGDDMADWDQEKLEQVVQSKQGAGERIKTDIVCKHFLDAVEGKKYGWFWECPNGGEKCQYKHALPPGFILRRDKKKGDGEKTEISLEEFLETERHKLGPNLTPITYESFEAWKKQRRIKLDIEEAERKKQKEAEFKAGRTMVSGKDLFSFQPDLFMDDEEAGDADLYVYDRDAYQEENDNEDGHYNGHHSSSLYTDGNGNDNDNEDDQNQSDSGERAQQRQQGGTRQYGDRIYSDDDGDDNNNNEGVRQEELVHKSRSNSPTKVTRHMEQLQV